MPWNYNLFHHLPVPTFIPYAISFIGLYNRLSARTPTEAVEELCRPIPPNVSFLGKILEAQYYAHLDNPPQTKSR